jgi:hypothetical protein
MKSHLFAFSLLNMFSHGLLLDGHICPFHFIVSTYQFILTLVIHSIFSWFCSQKCLWCIYAIDNQAITYAELAGTSTKLNLCKASTAVTSLAAHRTSRSIQACRSYGQYATQTVLEYSQVAEVVNSFFDDSSKDQHCVCKPCF